MFLFSWKGGLDLGFFILGSKCFVWIYDFVIKEKGEIGFGGS